MDKMLSISPKNISTAQLHGYLLGAIGPRPIAFASTVDIDGRPNLAPFSFFNVFSANPPVLIFSPARRVRGNTTKHTLENVLATNEVVINVVHYGLVQQMSLSSTEYEEGENEFLKAGLRMLPSNNVKPYRVAEAPVQFECKVTKVEALGKEGGAGNLIFSEVVKIHIAKDILDQDGVIDPVKIDLVARMGGNWYSRANKGLFEVNKPLRNLGIGVDVIPENIRVSSILTGNDLGVLGNVEKLPSETAIENFVNSNNKIKEMVSKNVESLQHLLAQEYIKKGEVNTAWMVLLAKH